MSVSEDAMKAQPDVEIGTESVQRGTRRASLDVGGLCRQDQHGSMSEYCW